MAAPRGSEVWRDYVTDGIPSSGANKPQKADIRSWSSWLESMVTSGVLSSGPWFATKAAMTLGYAANTVAIVYNDPTAANNGLYIKSGASGSGSWTQLTSFLPGYQFVTASPTGASTANAIVASTSPRLPAGDGVALVTLAIPATNTASPVTVRFDGGAVLTIKTRTGEDPDAGELQQNDVVAGFVSGATFRLISDLNSLRNFQSAKAWANNAEEVPVSTELGGDGVTTFSAKHWAAKSDESADRADNEADRSELARVGAESAAGVAAAIVNDIASEKEVPIVGVVQALPSLYLPVGMTAIRTNGFSVMGDGGEWPMVVEVPNTGDLKAWHRLTNGGARRWELRTNAANIKMFGAKGDGVTDDTWAAQYGDNYVASRGGGVLLYPPGDFVFSKIQASGSNPNVAVLLSNFVEHRGAGVDVTTVYLADGAFASNFFGRALVGATICHMTIDGNRANQGSPVFDGKDPCNILIGDSATSVHIHHVRLINAVDYAIGIQVAFVKDSLIHDYVIENAGADGFDNKNTGVASTNNRMYNGTIESFGMQGETGEVFAALNFRGDWSVDNVRINNLGYGIGATAGRDAIRFDNSGSTDPETGGGAKSSLSRVYISGYGTDYQNVARVQGVVLRDRDIRLSDFFIENIGRGVVRGQKNTHVSNGIISACRRGMVEDSTLTHAGNPLPTLPVYGTARDIVIKNCLEIGLRLEGNVEGNTYEGVIVDNCGVNISMAGTAKKNCFIGGASINAATPYTGGDGSNKFINVDGIVGLTKTMSADVDVASVGTKTVTVNHGLTAGTGSISASLQEYSVTAVGDYRAQARVTAITSTQVTLEVLVSVASATAGAKNRYEVTASKNQ